MEGVPRMPMLEMELKQNSFDYSGLDWSELPSEDVHEATQQQIVDGLKKHIKEEYGDDPEKYQDAIGKFIELQSQAYKAILSPDFEGCNTLKKYYGHLHYMQSRFPFSGDDSIKVTFAWQDAFTGILTVHESFTFEQTAILFNIGAIHSVLGAMDNRTTEEGIRISCVHFQCAAGLFAYIADHFDTTMSADISQAMLKLFTNVMLAQGQECLLEKSMQDNRKHSIVSKISQQVVDYYQQCLRSLDNRESENALGSQVYKYWKKVVNFKTFYYSAITKYFMGNNSQDQDKYGQAVGLFDLAVWNLNEATKLAKNLPKEIRPKADEALKFTSDVLNGKYASSVKDNNFVYHDKIPDKSSLPEIKGASLVKALPFEPGNPTLTGPDIFAKLVPMEAHLAASTYSEEKATLMRTVVGNIDEKDEILKQYKQSIELDPDKLINLEEVSKLDPELIEKSAQLSVDQSPIDKVKKAMDGLTDLYSELDSVLNNVLTLVEEEETADQKLKDMCGKDAFSSQEDVDKIKKELHVYKDLYHKTSQMNEDLHTACRVHTANLKIVSGGMEALREEVNLVNIADILTEDDKEVVELIRKLCDKVLEMEDQRKTLLQQLRQQMETDDVTSTLVTQHGIDKDDLFKMELKKHDSLIDTINKNLSAQDNILEAVTEANARYTKIRKTVDTEKERVDGKVSNLLLSCNSYEDVLDKCEEGRKFFAEVYEKAESLRKKIQELHEQNEEKRGKIYKKHEEKERAKKPPPRPTAPKPKLEPKKKTPVPQATPTTYPLSPDILAKMMVEDGDDELLNDPEFLQFLQAQGELAPGGMLPTVGMLPAMPGTAPLPNTSMRTPGPGARHTYIPSRPHTMPPPTSNQPPANYPAISTPLSVIPGHMPQSAPPMSPPVGSYASPSPQPALLPPTFAAHSNPPQVSSPLPAAPSPAQSSPFPPQHTPAMSQGGVASRSDALARSQMSLPQPEYPQQHFAGQDSRTVNSMHGPVSSLQDPRQSSIPAASQPYQVSQPPVIQPAHGQIYNSLTSHTSYVPTPPVASSPGPHIAPNMQATQAPAQQSPYHQTSLARHMPSPHLHAPQSTPSTTQIRPQVVHHVHYPQQHVQEQQQQLPQVPVQVSQVAIVYSAPPPQQSNASTWTHPTTFNTPASISQAPLTGPKQQNVGYPISQAPAFSQYGNQVNAQLQSVPTSVPIPFSSVSQIPQSYPGPQASYSQPQLSNSSKFPNGSPFSQNYAARPPLQQPLPVSQYQANLPPQAVAHQPTQQGFAANQLNSMQSISQPTPYSQVSPQISSAAAQHTIHAQALQQPGMQPQQQPNLHSQQQPGMQLQQQFGVQQQGSPQFHSPNPAASATFLGSNPPASLPQPNSAPPSQYQNQQANPTFQSPRPVLELSNTAYQQGNLQNQQSMARPLRPSSPSTPQGHFYTQGYAQQPQQVPAGQGNNQGLQQSYQQAQQQNMLPYTQPFQRHNKPLAGENHAQLAYPNQNSMGQQQHTIAGSTQQAYPNNLPGQQQPNMAQTGQFNSHTVQPVNQPLHNQNTVGTQPQGNQNNKFMQQQTYANQQQQAYPNQQPASHQGGLGQPSSLSQPPFQNPNIREEQQVTVPPMQYQPGQGGQNAMQPLQQTLPGQTGVQQHPSSQPFIPRQVAPDSQNVIQPTHQMYAAQPTQNQQQTVGQQVQNINQTRQQVGPQVQPSNNIPQESYPKQSMPDQANAANAPVPPTQNFSQPPKQNYTFKSQPHPGQYLTTPSNENSPKHVPSQRGRQGPVASNISNSSPAPTFIEPMSVLTPTPVNPSKPAPTPPQPSSDLAGLILTPSRSLSTSADELLSTNPDPALVEVKDKNQIVLVPTKVDEDSDSMVVRPVEGLPYMDEADLMKFKGQVMDFRAKVHDLLHKPESNGLCPLDREWKQLSETQEKFSRQLSTAVARCTSHKNKFQDVVPFDQSRVILKEAKDDYINASVIDGLSPFCPRFIATQSPLPNTCSDFWLMVYEQHVSLIVMLVNSKDVPKKCPIYWPADRAVSQQHGPLIVSFTTSKTHSDLYIERTFTIKHKTQSLAMSVTQLQYIAWPEHRLPSSANDLISFMQVVTNYHALQRNLQCPVLVHCESGVGRTGVFCAFIAGINEINAGMGIVDVADVVTKMRKKRKYMVQEKAQLKFVYDVILYHAIDVLKQRKVILEEELKPPVTPQQTHPPAHAAKSSSQFDIFSNQSALSSIQATVEKMTIKQGQEKDKRSDSNPPQPHISSKSCSEISSAVSTHIGSDLTTRSLHQLPATMSHSFDSAIPPNQRANLNELSDLVQGTMSAPTPSSTHISITPPNVPQNTSPASKPDIVESCGGQSQTEGKSEHTINVNEEVNGGPQGPKSVPLIESLTPESFTLEPTTEENNKPKKVTKEDFFKPRPGLISEGDPMDPFSGLDPLWGLKK